MGDFELLQAYARRGDEDAFTELVNRHIALVYSAALRQTSDPHAAAEITQSVFIILARKAQTIRQGAILAGWLLRTTRYTAANARRREQHRHETEQQAMDHLYPIETEAAWKQVAPLLDEALVHLKEKDRDVVALRFFEQRTYKEIGSALSLSEDNARKRVSRAIDRLRSILGKAGCGLPVAAVAAAISAGATGAAPAGLASTVAGNAVAKGAATAATLPLLVQTTLKTLRWLQWRGFGIRTATALVTFGLLFVLFKQPSVYGKAQPIRATGIGAEAAVRPATPGKPAPSEDTSPGARSVPEPNGEGLLLRVLDADSQAPLARARLTLTWITEFPDRRTNSFETDAQGQCMVPIDRKPVKNWSSRIEVFKNGYVPKYVSWSASQGDALDGIPSQYTAHLTRGTEIGGVVLNEQGEPVPEVRVVFSVSGPAPGASHDRERLTMMGHYHSEVTDLQGRWHCDHVPQQFGMITYEFLHPLYLAARFGSTTLSATTTLGMNYVTEAELRNGTTKTPLKPGPLVAGAVVDQAGNGISHAKVTENRGWYEPSASEETGGAGLFRFSNSSQKDLVLTVQARDFAPMDVTVHPGVQTESLRLELSRGEKLSGRVVDELGQPIANAKVRVSASESGMPRFEWSAKTDNEGRFEWLTAPGTGVVYDIGAADHETQSKLELVPDGSEHLITLRRNGARSAAVHISGTVVDSANGKPIEGFRVITATTEGEKTASGFRTTSTSSPEIQLVGAAGKFSFAASSSVLHYMLEVQAAGYVPARVEVDGPVTNDCKVAFELKRGVPVTGVVRLPDGSPVTNAVVILSSVEARQESRFPTRMETVFMKLPGEFDLVQSQGSRTTTDDEGRFSFEPKLGMKNILIAHKSGYAQVPVDQLGASPAVILQPWGRVAGALQIGNRPGGNETLYLRNWGWAHLFSPSLRINLEAKTDSEGRFTVEGVPPGEWQISHEVRLRSGSTDTAELKPVKIKMGSGTSMLLPRTSGPSLSSLVRVEPGQTTQVKLGGTGRKVVGKVKSNGASGRIDWQRDVQRLTSKASRPNVGPFPKRDDFTSEQEYGLAQTKWQTQAREFWLSEAGTQAKGLPSEYVPVFEADGSFHIDDVIPGAYELTITVSDPAIPESFFLGNPIGKLTKEITVPEGGEGTAREPFDLGELELNASTQ